MSMLVESVGGISLDDTPEGRLASKRFMVWIYAEEMQRAREQGPLTEIFQSRGRLVRAIERLKEVDSSVGDLIPRSDSNPVWVEGI